jgi:hypothetical protein
MKRMMKYNQWLVLWYAIWNDYHALFSEWTPSCYCPLKQHLKTLVPLALFIWGLLTFCILVGAQGVTSTTSGCTRANTQLLRVSEALIPRLQAFRKWLLCPVRTRGNWILQTERCNKNNIGYFSYRKSAFIILWSIILLRVCGKICNMWR